ncbi:MAG: hypothetical protein NTU44_10950 [Bacteroidetes bacterium]|nr:hypothetical protein [Bacteroidota bacterium]
MLFSLIYLAVSLWLFFLMGELVIIPFGNKNHTGHWSAYGVGLKALTGFLWSIPLLSFISLFSPVNSRLFLILFLLLNGWFFLYHNKNRQSNSHQLQPGSQFRSFSSEDYPWLLVILLLLVSVQPVTLPDTWGYHAQTLQWIEKYPVIPGLGNLCTKFAFNFGSFLPLALLSSRAVLNQPLWGINFFLWVLVVVTLSSQTRHWSREKKPILSFLLLLTVLLGIHYFKSSLSSTSVECTSAALILLLFFLVSGYDNLNKTIPTSILDLLVLSLCVCLPVIKLTNIFIALFALPFYRLTFQRNKWILPLLALIFWLPWIARNIILSGYLVYPFPFLDPLTFSWKIPNDLASQDFQWIRSWARLPFINYYQVLNAPVSFWIRTWAAHLGLFNWLLLGSGILLSSVFILSGKAWKTIPPLVRWLWIIFALAIIPWFFLAPDPRFIIGSLILFPVIPAFYLISFYLPICQGTANAVPGKLAGSPMINHSMLVITIIFAVSEIFLINPLTNYPMIKPPGFPSTPMKTEKAGWLEVHTPVKGVNCYDFPIPSAPHLIPGITPRTNQIEKGFMIKAK